MSEPDPSHFRDLAVGYYVTVRFAALNRLNIAPNLMHHTIELLIKATRTCLVHSKALPSSIHRRAAC